MTTRIQADGPRPDVAVTQTSTRVTPSPGQPFKNVLNTGANAVMQGANAAVQRLPGGPVLAAAVRTPPTEMSPTDPASGASGSAGSVDGVSTGGSPNYGGDMSGALQQQAENSMYYLQLQQQIQEETRAFTTISNVLKARHDTVKNAINNVR